MWQLWAITPAGEKTLINEYTLDQEVWLTQDIIWLHNRDRLNQIVRALRAEWV